MKLFANFLPSASSRASRSFCVAGLLCGAFFASPSARAQVAYATGGTGLYKNNIAWLTWGGGTNGTNGTVLNSGATNTTNIMVGNNTLAITTTLSNVTNGGTPATNALVAYRSGAYSGDGLDNLYNINGSNTNNQLVAGIENAVVNTTISFQLTLSATFNGTPIVIPSVVLADAEVTSEPRESVLATADGNWSVIELSAGCTNTANAEVTAPSGTLRTLKFSNPAGCGLNIAGPSGIASVAFNPSAYTNNSVTINATVQGFGRNALAIGLMLPFDYGDAPASTYGYAAHMIPQIFNNPLAVGTTENINARDAGGNRTYAFASLTSPALRLGTRIDADNNSYTGSATLTQDDNNLGAGGTNDEDGVTFSAIPVTRLPLTQTVASYSVTTSVYNATGQAANLVGWIDWDNNGVFDATEAATATAPSTGGSANVTLTWTNQTVVGTLGQRGVNSRFRLTTDALTASTASGGASNGEVEDYIIPFTQPLPVTLVSFTANATKSCAVNLAWQTASEQNSARYEVQRSADGKAFATVGTVASRNSASGATYSFRDGQPLAETSYYRLRMVDTDGTTSFSPTAVVAQACGHAALTLVPNPASSAVSVKGLQAGQQLRAFAADGRLVYSSRVADPAQPLGLAGWHQGLYLLHVLNADGTTAGSLRLIKE